MDERTKQLFMQKVFYLRDDIDRLKKRRRKRIASLEDCVGTPIQGIEECIKKPQKELFQKPTTAVLT